MTKNRTPTLVYLDSGMHPGMEVKGLRNDRHVDNIIKLQRTSSALEPHSEVKNSQQTQNGLGRRRMMTT